MANPGEIFIHFEKPKQSLKLFHFVSEGLLSSLHSEKMQKKLDLNIQESNKRTLLHYSCYLDLHAITLYLILSGVQYTVLDKSSQSCFFGLFAKGNFKTLQTFLNYHSHLFKKELSDWLTLLKFGFSMTNVSLQNTIAFYLSKTLSFSKLPDKPIESKLELAKRLEGYFKKILELNKFILLTQDSSKRTPLHYAALSKFTWCFKAVETILEDPEEFYSFTTLFSQVNPLVSSQTIDPNRYTNILNTVQEVLADLYDKIYSEFLKNLENLKKTCLNVKDLNGQTPLHLACLSGDFKIVKLFIKHGADKSIKDRNNKKPLDLCSTKLVMRYLSSLSQTVAEKDAASLTHMANSGYNVNDSINTYMLSALHLAVMNGGLVKSVLNFEGDVNQCEWNNYTPLHISCIKGSLDNLTLLIKENANVSARSSAGLTPLHLACRYDKIDLIHPLLEAGADINALDHNARTPIMLASKYGCLKSVKKLLVLRCNYLLVDKRLWNCLHYASFHCKGKVARLLVKWDSDRNDLVNMKNSQGKIPLALTSDVKTRKSFDNIWNAAASGNLDLVRRILRTGGDVNEATQGDRKTALMMAAKAGSVLMAKFLIENGAKVDMIDNNGNTAADYVDADDTKLRFIIESKSKKKNQVTHARTNSF